MGDGHPVMLRRIDSQQSKERSRVQRERRGRSPPVMRSWVDRQATPLPLRRSRLRRLHQTT
jgi:hypothetical protein